jgi:hypothetical protein
MAANFKEMEQKVLIFSDDGKCYHFNEDEDLIQLWLVSCPSNLQQFPAVF